MNLSAPQSRTKTPAINDAVLKQRLSQSMIEELIYSVWQSHSGLVLYHSEVLGLVAHNQRKFDHSDRLAVISAHLQLLDNIQRQNVNRRPRE